MENAFSKEQLQEQLDRCTRSAALTFGLLVCERMQPGFIAFAEATGAVGRETLRETLDRAWSALERRRTKRVFTSEEIADVEALAPDPGDSEHLLASAAMDTALALGLAMRCMNGESLGSIGEIASLARDGVDLVVQEREGMSPQDPMLEERILRHPLMQQELRRQQETLEMVTISGRGLVADIPRIRETFCTGILGLFHVTPGT